MSEVSLHVDFTGLADEDIGEAEQMVEAFLDWVAEQDDTDLAMGVAGRVSDAYAATAVREIN